MKQLTVQQQQWVDGQVPPANLVAGQTLSSIINDLYNFGGQAVTYTSNATPNTADSVPHTLGRVPVGYIVISRSAAGTTYNGGAAGAFSATATSISLKCGVASMVTTLIVF